MTLLLAAVAVLLATGMAALIPVGTPSRRSVIAASGALFSAALGIYPACQTFLSGAPAGFSMAWGLPVGMFRLFLDPLSAFFLIPLFILCGSAAIYGRSYLSSYPATKAVAGAGFFNLLFASLILVFLSHDSVLFLLSWEVMSLSSFILIMFDHEKRDVCRAGFLYLVTMHAGTAFLFAMFFLLSREYGSTDFAQYGASFSLLGNTAIAVFFCAIAGFGTKAGIMPFHVWLPEAHPATPSHVSAVLSGIMIKTGLYGILRILTFYGHPPVVFGWVLAVLGALSAVLGVLFALAQHDMKRLLAYSSIENMGLLFLSAGVGVLGLSYGYNTMAVLGFTAVLFHTAGHAFFKGILFLAAGAVVHGAGTREINELGGLFKRMRVTGTLFLLASAALAGLPPLSGFVTEFLLLFASFSGINAVAPLSVGAAVILIAVSVTAAFAVIAFTKVFGIAFLGEPRTEKAAHAHDAPLGMKIPMVVLAVCALVLSLSAPWAVRLLLPVVGIIMGDTALSSHPAVLFETLPRVYFILLTLTALFLLIAAIRILLLKNRRVRTSVTWDCGFSKPHPRMQYTGSSYVGPITDTFVFLLRSSRKLVSPRGLFPRAGEFQSETGDVFNQAFLRPLMEKAGREISRMRAFQHGFLPYYLLYTVLTLIGLLLWKL